MTAHPSYPTMQLPSDEGGGLIPKLIVMAGAALLAMMVSSGASPLIATFILLLFMLPVVVLDPKTAICATFIFLPIMGDLRRLLIQEAVGSNDPVLLVGPIIAIGLAGLAYSQGRLNRQSRLSKAVLLLMGIMVLQIFNPLQGGLMVGVGGAMFYLIPLLWFWIGQSWGTAEFVETVAFRVIVPVATLAAVFGLKQAFAGFYPYQLEALHRQFSGPLLLGSNLRPMGFFISTAEFVMYLAMAIVMGIGCLFAKRVRLALLPVPLIAFSLFMAGCRGPIVGSVATSILLWALPSKTIGTAITRLGLAVICIGGGLIWTLHHVDNGTDLVTDDASRLIRHQTGGLLNPTDEKKSTGAMHTGMFVNGLMAGVYAPFGHGLGSTTNAAGKFGGAGSSSETDIGDIFLSLGLLGGFTYLYILYLGFSGSARLARQHYTSASLIILATLLVNFNWWLRGGAYSTVAIVWFLVGSLDRALKNDVKRNLA
jgi:hypothetical protein